MAVGRTTTRYVYVIVGDTGNALREIPVDSIGDIGVAYEAKDLSAWADAIKNMFAGQGNAPIKIGGPFDNSAAVTAPASAAAHALSGSHTVLAPINGDNLPHTLQIEFGIRGNWATGDPVFGLQKLASAGSGYTLTKYTVNGDKYSAEFEVMGSVAPAWGTAQLSAGA